ncbi:CRE-SRB-17 protein, partial [Aphelenchoides avenae]
VLQMQFNNCTAAALIGSSSAIHILEAFQILISLLAIALCLLNIFCRTLEPNPSTVHPNLRVIVIVGTSFYIVHAAGIIATQIQHLVKYFGSRDPCDYQMELGLCLLLKAPCYVAIVGFTLFHVTLFVERAAATLLLRNYEAAKPTWGLFAALGMVTTALAWNVFIFYDSPFSENITYCVVTTQYTSQKLLYTNYVLIVLDFMASVGDFCLLRTNQRAKPVLMEYSRYSLSCCYQLKENRLTTRLIFPQSVAHSATFLCYLAIATGVRQFVQNHDAYAYTVLVESVHSVSVN